MAKFTLTNKFVRDIESLSYAVSEESARVANAIIFRDESQSFSCGEFYMMFRKRLENMVDYNDVLDELWEEVDRDSQNFDSILDNWIRRLNGLYSTIHNSYIKDYYKSGSVYDEDECEIISYDRVNEAIKDNEQNLEHLHLICQTMAIELFAEIIRRKKYTDILDYSFYVDFCPDDQKPSEILKEAHDKNRNKNALDKILSDSINKQNGIPTKYNLKEGVKSLKLNPLYQLMINTDSILKNIEEKDFIEHVMNADLSVEYKDGKHCNIIYMADRLRLKFEKEWQIEVAKSLSLKDKNDITRHSVTDDFRYKCNEII